MKKIFNIIFFILLGATMFAQSGEAYTLPQKTTTERDAITGMITGEAIFNTTTNQYEFWDGTAWQPFGGSGGSSTALIDADGDTKVDVEESADEDIIRFDAGGQELFTMSENTGTSTLNIVNPTYGTNAKLTYDNFGNLLLDHPDVGNISFAPFTSSIGITFDSLFNLAIAGGTTPIQINSQVGSSLFALGSTTHPPRIVNATSVVRDAVVNPQTGAMMWNTTVGEMQWYDGTNWTGQEYIEGVIHTLDNIAVTTGDGVYSFVAPFDCTITEVTFRSSGGVGVSQLDARLRSTGTPGINVNGTLATIPVGSHTVTITETLLSPAQGDLVRIRVEAVGTSNGLTATFKYEKR